MVTLKHNVVYKHFYKLVVFLLAFPVTLAFMGSDRLDLIKSAVRTSMGSDKLADLVLI